MSGWIGPALIAAVIAAVVSVFGWFVTAGLSFRAEQRRRDDKARDFMIALRAEIRSELDELAAFDLHEDLDRVESRYAEDSAYRVFVSRMVASAVADAIAPEIFILPEGVIGPVVLYLRQRHAVCQMIDELRLFDRDRYGKEQEILLFNDLQSLRVRLKTTARSALHALEELT